MSSFCDITSKRFLFMELRRIVKRPNYHCSFRNDNGRVFLFAFSTAFCSVSHE